MLGRTDGLLDNGSRLLIGEPISNPCWFRHIHLYANTVGNALNSPPPSYLVRLESLNYYYLHPSKILFVPSFTLTRNTLTIWTYFLDLNYLNYTHTRNLHFFLFVFLFPLFHEQETFLKMSYILHPFNPKTHATVPCK